MSPNLLGPVEAASQQAPKHGAAASVLMSAIPFGHWEEMRSAPLSVPQCGDPEPEGLIVTGTVVGFFHSIWQFVAREGTDAAVFLPVLAPCL